MKPLVAVVTADAVLTTLLVAEQADPVRIAETIVLLEHEQRLTCEKYGEQELRVGLESLVQEYSSLVELSIRYEIRVS